MVTKDKLPRVGVVIPCYNYEKYVGEALESIYTQTYPRELMRICCVDDGSTDGSWKAISSLDEEWEAPILNDERILKSVGGRHKGMQHSAFRLSENFGPSVSRNIAIQHLWDDVDVYAFLDADDLYQPEKIEKSVKKLQEFPGMVGAVYTDYVSHNINTGVKAFEYKPSFSRAKLLQECIVNNDSIVLKDALNQAGLYDESMRCAEDFHLWIRLSRFYNIIHIPEFLLTVRVHGAGATESRSKDEWNKNWQKIRDMVAKEGGGG